MPHSLGGDDDASAILSTVRDHGRHLHDCGGGTRPGSGTAERGAWLGSSARPVAGLQCRLDREHDRLTIKVPGTPHVLSAEVPQLPMNAPRVVRRVRGDFTAGVQVLGRLEPGRSRTTHYDPYHGAGLIVWQDPSNYLRLERAVGFINGRHHPYINYELRGAVAWPCRTGSRPKIIPSSSSSGDKARRSRPGTAAMDADGSSSRGSTRPSPNGSTSVSSPSTLPSRHCRPNWRGCASTTPRARWLGTMGTTTRQNRCPLLRHREKVQRFFRVRPRYPPNRGRVSGRKGVGRKGVRHCFTIVSGCPLKGLAFRDSSVGGLPAQLTVLDRALSLSEVGGCQGLRASGIRRHCYSSSLDRGARVIANAYQADF